MGIALAVYLLLAVVLGGSTRPGGWEDGLLAVLGLPLLAFGAWHCAKCCPPRLAIPLLALALATLALPLAQLLPLPALPLVGGSLRELHAAFAAVPPEALGLPAPLQWSLAPSATWWSLAALVPPMAVLLSATSLRDRERERLLKVVLVLACLQALVALMQLPAAGAQLPAFQGNSLAAQALGFFANRNHLGLLMLVGAGLALSALWQSARRLAEGEARRHEALAAFAALAAALLCLLALLQSQSRAAVGIGVVLGLIAAVVFMFGRSGRAGAKRTLVVVAGLLLLVVNLGAYGVMQRFSVAPLDAERATMARQTAALAQEAMPWGTGLGSFASVYAQREPELGLADPRTNHAHNDWLEWWLETGLAGLVLLAGWLTLLAWRLWRASPWTATQGLAALLLAAPLLHSLVDYPLRTLTLACVTAVLVSVLIAPRARPTAT